MEEEYKGVSEWKAKGIEKGYWQYFEAEVINEVVKYIDELELKDTNDSLESWKQYKYIRNNIRDKYKLTNPNK